MIPNFDSYNILNESVSLNEIQKNRKSYGSVKRDFTSKGYECLGNITFENRHRKGLKYQEVLDVIPSELCDKFKKKESTGFVSGTPNKDYVDVNLWGCDDESKFLSIFMEPNVENVIACITQKGDLYYCLYNDEKKYFYYVTYKKPPYWVSDNGSTVGCFELFIKLRTSSAEEISNELDEYCEEYIRKKKEEEEERLRKEEERRIQREKEEEERRIKLEKQKEYEKRVEVIKADVEENPENYEMVESGPSIDDDYDSKYVKYILHGRRDPYDVESVIVYVNDDNLTKGYKYVSSINHARPGTYWGD